MSDGLNRLMCDGATLLAGRWELLDTLAALPLRNELIKSGVVGACFVAAWLASGDAVTRAGHRRNLMITLLAALAALGISTCLSNRFAMPRPYVFEQQVYRLERGELVPQAQRPLRRPLDNASQERYRRLANLDLPRNDFGSFPSDHAALFAPLSLGIWLVSRRIGMLALVWTTLVILFPKLHLGFHTSGDIAAGAILGAFLLGLFGSLSRLPPLRQALDTLSALSLRHEGWFGGLLFLVVYETCSKFDHLEQLLHGLARRLLN